MSTNEDDYLEVIAKKLLFDLAFVAPEAKDVQLLKTLDALRAALALVRVQRAKTRERELVRHMLREANIDSWTERKGVRPTSINLEACEPSEENITTAILYFESVLPK